MNVDRLYRIAAGALQDVVHLRQAQEVAVVGLIAWPPAAIEVGAIGCRSHHRQDNVIAAEAQIVRRIAGMEREFRRAVRDELEDHVAVEAHPFATFADVGAMRLHDVAHKKQAQTIAPVS